MINILFTCAGRRNYLINYFKEALDKQGKVYAMDMDKLAPAMVDADVSIQCPAIYDEDYIPFLKDVVKKYDINAVISLNDLELPILANHKAEIEDANTKIIVSKESVIDITFDKLKCFEFFKKNNLLTPKTYSNLKSAKEAIFNGELQFPVVLKPRWGSASIGIDFPETIEELELAYKLQKIKLKRSILSQASESEINKAILIQEKIKGKEYGIDILNDFEQNFVGSFAKEKLSMRSGETDKSISIKNDKLHDIGKKISQALGHIGNLDCDVMIADEKAYVIELNPRFGGGYPFTHESGVNIASIYIEWIKGSKNVEHLINFTPGIAFSKCDTMIRVNANNDISLAEKEVEFEVITKKENWDAVLKEIDSFDFYHTFDYHQMSISEDEKCVLLVYREDQTIIALPFILRPIHGTIYFDITSVYGYSGPLSRNVLFSFDNQLFASKLEEFLNQNKIVSIFSRLDPFIHNQKQVLHNIGVCENMSSIVYIDLSNDIETQRKGYQRRIKSQINRARRLCDIKKAKTNEDINAFIDLYYENMDRVNADKSYYFDREYFFNLFTCDNSETDLLLAIDKESNQIIAGAMFICTNNIVQYHLSGTKTEFLNFMPIKMLIDEVRIIATKKGCKYLNLGGGYRNMEDSLFRFKSSFSKTYKTFYVWKYIVNTEIYNNLLTNKNTSLTNYFPAYRNIKEN